MLRCCDAGMSEVGWPHHAPPYVAGHTARECCDCGGADDKPAAPRHSQHRSIAAFLEVPASSRDAATVAVLMMSLPTLDIPSLAASQHSINRQARVPRAYRLMAFHSRS
jgi:hypothetical protein